MMTFFAPASMCFAASGRFVPKPVDWNDLRVRLDRIGASGFQLTQDIDGWRFTCTLPNGGQLDARGTSDADAVQRALVQIEAR